MAVLHTFKLHVLINMYFILRCVALSNFILRPYTVQLPVLCLNSNGSCNKLYGQVVSIVRLCNRFAQHKSRNHIQTITFISEDCIE